MHLVGLILAPNNIYRTRHITTLCSHRYPIRMSVTPGKCRQQNFIISGRFNAASRRD
jgi:hypothetical protein